MGIDWLVRKGGCRHGHDDAPKKNGDRQRLQKIRSVSDAAEQSPEEARGSV
jgi:hypothetical protein